MKTKPYILFPGPNFRPHSNRLKKVTDAGNAQYGFKDDNTNGIDYAYDANGNLTKDLNKHITQITYNVLNLPKKITITGNNGGTIQFYYTATGQKVQKTVQSNAGTTTTNYDHGFIYKNGQLQFFSQPEGYIKANDDGSFTYVFQYKDQLGNIRLSFKNTHNGTILNPDVAVVEAHDYYPFGLQHKGYNETPNNGGYPYKYNGKELEDALGLDWYDYGARWYDAAVGRWWSVDPMANHPNQVDKSPYSYTWNNPVNLTDPNGECPDCPDEVYVPIASHVYDAEEGDVTSNGWEVVHVDQNSETGYKGALYKGTYEGETEYIYATAGTEPTSLKDWENNAKQIIGYSPQYQKSVNLAKTYSNKYEGVSFTGHSLGGGLASANALSVNGKAVTFNAAGLSPFTKATLGLSGKTANISAYVVQGEIVDYLQSKIGLKAAGNIHYLPANYFPEIPLTKGDNYIRTYQRIKNHSMGVVAEKFYENITK